MMSPRAYGGRPRTLYLFMPGAASILQARDADWWKLCNIHDVFTSRYLVYNLDTVISNH